MKNLKVVMLAALAVTGLAACSPKECDVHTDKNHDGVCEVCGKTGLPVNHVDENPKDHKCDVCEKVLSECADSDHDHKCDYCGATMSECVDASPKDHKCDVCGKVLSECVDADHDSFCDICGKGGMEVHHKDENGDGKCDSCGIDIICESYRLDVSGAVTEFGKGSSFTANGVKVIGSFTDETEKELTFEVKEADKPDMSKVGKQEVTVTFLVNGIEKTLSYEIVVSNWSDAALAIFKNVSLFSAGEGAYPYMPGLDAAYDLDEEGYAIGWHFFKENGSLNDVKAYWEIFKNYEYVASVSGHKVHFETTELDAEEYEFEGEPTIAQQYGIKEGTLRLFKVVPYEIGEYGEERCFISDEYVLFGLDEETGSFVGYNKLVSSALDGVFGADDLYFAYWKSKEITPEISSLLQEVPSYYYSEAAESLMPQAKISDGYAMLTSILTAYPFDSSLDEYQMAYRFDAINGSLNEEEQLRASLLKVGFVQDSENANIYVYEDDIAGSIEYHITPFSEHHFSEMGFGPIVIDEEEIDNGFAYSVYYKAPYDYTYVSDYAIDYFGKYYAEQLAADSICEGHEVNYEFLYLDSQYGFNVGIIEIGANEAGEGVSSEDVAQYMINNMNPTYAVVGCDYDSENGCYVISVTDYETEVEFDVYDADKNGVVEIDIFAENYVSKAQYYLDAITESLFRKAVESVELVPYSYFACNVGIGEAGVKDLAYYANLMAQNLAKLFGVNPDQFGQVAANKYIVGFNFSDLTFIAFVYEEDGVVGVQFHSMTPVDPLTLAYQVGLAVNSQPLIFVNEPGLGSGGYMPICAASVASEDDIALAINYLLNNSDIFGYVDVSQDFEGHYSFTVLSYDISSEIYLSLSVIDGYYFLLFESGYHKIAQADVIASDAHNFFGMLGGNPSMYATGAGYEISAYIFSEEYDAMQLAQLIIAYKPSYTSVVSQPVVGENGEVTFTLLSESEEIVLQYTIAPEFKYFDLIIETAEEFNEAKESGIQIYTYDEVSEEYVLIAEDAEFVEGTEYFEKKFSDYALLCEVDVLSSYIADVRFSVQHMFEFIAGVGEPVAEEQADGSYVITDIVSDFGTMEYCEELIKHYVEDEDYLCDYELAQQVSEIEEIENGYSVTYENAEAGVTLTLTVTLDEENNIVVTITGTQSAE